jgi:putative DNA primase/helicase
VSVALTGQDTSRQAMNPPGMCRLRIDRNCKPVDLKQLAHALRGDISGQQVLCPGPGHSARDRSLAVRLAPDSRLGFVIHSHAGDRWRDCLEYVLERLGSARWELNSEKKPCGNAPAATADLWKEVWREAEPLNHLALSYLASRGINELPLPNVHDVLRFHPRCPFGPGEKRYCMIGLLRNVITNTPQAVHRTALTPEGKKLGRKVLGSKSGAAVKLWPDDEVSAGLVIGEGLETALSAATRIADGGTLLRPAWAVGDAGNLAAFPVLPGVDSLTILVDHDESGTGQRAALECSRRWTNAGQEVFRIIPNRRGDDINDFVQRTVA